MSEEKKICPICTFPTSLPLINGKCVSCLSSDELEIYYQGRRDMKEYMGKRLPAKVWERYKELYD